MPVYNVETYLAEAIDSILNQSHRKLELILVDDGSTDGSPAICQSYVERDERVRLVEKVNGGLGAARNTGVRFARGEFLAFADSDDIVLPRAYERMVTSLQRSKSDVATGNVQRLQSGRRWQAWNQSRSHVQTRRAITVAQEPALLFDMVAWNKVFRTDFFRRHAIHFPERKLYEDMAPMCEVFLLASGIDVIAEHVYVWRLRDEGDSISQRRIETSNLADKLEMIATVDRLLSLHDETTAMRDTFTFKTLDGDLWIYLRSIGAGASPAPEFISLLEEAAQTYWVGAPAEVKANTSQERRVLFELLAARRGSEIERVRDWYIEHADGLPIVVEGNRARIDRSAFPVSTDGLAVDVLDVTGERPLRATLTHASWSDRATLRVEGYAYIPAVTDGSQQIELLARSADDEAPHVFATDRCASPEANEWARDRTRPHDQDGFVALVPLGPLVADVSRDNARTWSFTVRVRQDGLEQETPLDTIWRGGSCAVLGTTLPAPGISVRGATDANKPLRLVASTTEYRLDSVDIDGSVVAVHPDSEVELVATSTDTKAVVPFRTDGVRSGSAAVFPTHPSRYWTTWKLRARDSDGALRPVSWIPEDRAHLRSGPFIAEFNLWGEAVVTERRDTLLVTSSRCDNGCLVLEGEYFDDQPVDVEIGLRASSAHLDHWTPVVVDGTRFTAVLPLHAEDWYGIERALPSGTYSVVARAAQTKTEKQVFVSNSGAVDLPLHFRTSLLRGQLDRAALARLTLKLQPPVPDVDLGRYALEANRRAFGDRAVVEPSDSVFFSVDMGAGAADSALAIHREIVARGLPLTSHWGVSDFSVPVPPGAVPVLKGTRHWYETLARARYVVNNYGGLDGLHRRVHQRQLQTWHGTALKHVGASEARAQHDAPQRLATIAAEAAAWDAVVSPSPYMTDLIRSDFLFQGTVLESGYPRNDRLARGDDDSSLRARLGLDPETRVMLYAPTFREELRSGWTASLFEGLDLDRLSALLGPGWTIVLRGHSFNARRADGDRSRGNIVDLTRHHDINDLYLVSDVLVTDYSSVMFDYAVTGRPMHFFVPDLKAYARRRGMYMDLADLAPGPVVSTVAALARGLKKQDVLTQRYHRKYEEFRSTYAPWDDGNAASRVVDWLLAESHVIPQDQQNDN
ncbi:MAG: glycosyltransferase family 2 protein [Microbacterium sp.]|nr:MAG: glycosyltransferase family 2 protein [Microbacterium sp.]